MGYGLRKFGVEYEAARRISVPSYDHPLFRKSVERGIYLSRREYLAVESELALIRGRVEDTNPFRIRPAGGPHEETARVRLPLRLVTPMEWILEDMSQLLIGTGGWAYFKVPGTDSLEAYSHAYDLVELNSSYYELPPNSSASDWRKRVPPHFRFSRSEERRVGKECRARWEPCT